MLTHLWEQTFGEVARWARINSPWALHFNSGSCGTKLTAGASAAVFGGGRPTGTFGAAEVFTGNLSLICGTMTNRSLCLSNNVMESVILRSAAGATLSTFASPG